MKAFICLLALLVAQPAFGVGMGFPFPIRRSPPGGFSSSYTWSLGELAGDSARVDVLWNTGAWADPYDTQAELTTTGSPGSALAYQVVTLQSGTYGGIPVTINCAADTTDPKDEDEAAVNTIIAQTCNVGGDCRTGSRGGVVFVGQSSCTYDMLVGSGNSDTPPALSIARSHMAIVGAGMDSTRFYCNDVIGNDDPHGPCFANTGGGSYGQSLVGSAFGWKAGGSKGDGASTSVNPVVLESCAGLANWDKVRLAFLDPDGRQNYIYSKAEEVLTGQGDGDDCHVKLTLPLAITVGTRQNVQEAQAPSTNFLLISGIEIAFPNAVDGAMTQNGGLFPAEFDTAGALIRLMHADDVILDSSRFGKYTMGGIRVHGNDRYRFAHNEVGPCQMCKRRGTNGGVMAWGGYSSSSSVFDNEFGDGAKRFVSLDRDGHIGTWIGFNDLGDQLATAPLETGNHCDGVGNPQGLAMHSDSGGSFPPSTERAIFIMHDAISSGGRLGYYLVEGNHLNCGNFLEGDSPESSRYGTFFRNRSTRVNGAIIYQITGSFPQHHLNWFANRFRNWGGDAGKQPNVLGRWNMANDAMSNPTSTGAVWPTSVGSFGRNMVSSGAHPDCPHQLPPSLALRQDTKPSWWCQEIPWSDAFTMGSCDGQDGIVMDNPATRRRKGLPCTP